MNDAEYYRPPARNLWLHRIGSLLAFALMFWLALQGYLGGSVRSLAVQFIALGFIWFSNDYYHDRILKRMISYRALAWIALVGLPIAIPTVILIFSLIFQ